MRTLIIRLFLLSGLLFPALAAAVAPNTAPTFFVGDGMVTIAIGSSFDGQSVTVQADGKILVAEGQAISNSHWYATTPMAVWIPASVSVALSLLLFLAIIRLAAKASPFKRMERFW